MEDLIGGHPASMDIIVVTSRDRRFLEPCLTAAGGVAGVRILVVANGADDEMREYLRAASLRDPAVVSVILDRPVGKSRARNIGIENSSASILYFVDDDARPSPGTVEGMLRAFAAHPEVDVVGGPNVTPPGSTWFQRVSGHVFSSPFTAAGMHLRYRPGAGESYCDDSALALCNMAVRREALLREDVRFDERLRYNEENLLLNRLAAGGSRMLYCPGLSVLHERRADAAGFARQIYESGRGRALMTFIMPSSWSFVYLLPALFVLYLALLPFVSHRGFLLPLAAYGALNLLNVLYVLLRAGESPAGCLAVLLLSVTAHVSYGIGFLRGLAAGAMMGSGYGREEAAA